MTRPATCRFERPCVSCDKRPAAPRRLRCHRCAARSWRLAKKAYLPVRPCVVCREPVPVEMRTNAEVCGPDCKSYRNSVKARKPGACVDPREVFPARHEAEAMRLMRTLHQRGYKKVGRRTARSKVCGAYYAAWKHRSLFVVRWFDPAEARRAA